jgi:DNA-binding response OmpR family regulator
VVCVLIAEDNLMFADLLEEMLIGAGYTVCGIAASVAEAVKLGNAHQPDLAILDMRLQNDELGSDIVPLLTKCKRVGILYASGSDTADLTVAQGDACIRKPYSFTELLEALQIVQQIVAGTTTLIPVSRGVRLLGF